MESKLFRKGIFVVALLLASAVSGVEKDYPMTVNSISAGESVVSAPASGLVTRSGRASTMIKINNSCFGTNLREVGNPLARNSIVSASILLSINGKDYPIKVKYPALLVT